jgi:hypothetical protein
MADLLLRSPLTYEPKKINRWLIRFPNDVGIQTWALKSAARPKVNITKNEMKFINTSTFVNGSYVWSEIPMTIRDFIAPSQSQALIEWFRLHAESVTGRMGYNVGSAKNIEIEVLDPTGVVVEKWLCVNCIIVGEVDFGQLDYDNDDVMEISFNVQPQYCVHLFG